MISARCSFGDAGSSSEHRLRASETVTSISATPSGAGYWLFTDLGRVITFGDATFLGDMSGVKLQRPSARVGPDCFW